MAARFKQQLSAAKRSTQRLRKDHELTPSAADRLVTAYLKTVPASSRSSKARSKAAVGAILDADKEHRSVLVMAILRRLRVCMAAYDAARDRGCTDRDHRGYNAWVRAKGDYASDLMDSLLKRRPALSDSELVALLSTQNTPRSFLLHFYRPLILGVERFLLSTKPSSRLAKLAEREIRSLREGHARSSVKLADRLTMALKHTHTNEPIMPPSTLSEADAGRLLDKFIQTTPKDTYTVTHLPESAEIQSILALDGAELRTLVCIAARRVTEIRRTFSEQLKEDPNAIYMGNKWVQRNGLRYSLLLAKILARRIEFTDAELVILVHSLFTEEYSQSVYDSVAIKAVEHYALENTLSRELSDALKEYVRVLRKGQSKNEVTLADRISSHLNKQFAVRSASRKSSIAERLLLNRESHELTSPPLVDAFVAAMVVPDRTSAVPVFFFGEITTDPSPAPGVIEAVNHVLRSAPAEYQHGDARRPKTLYKSTGVPAAVAALAAAAAMSTKPIRFGFDDHASLRYHNGCETLVAFARGALIDAPAASPAEIAHVCHSLSRLRSPEYVYPPWNDYTSAICRLLNPHVGALAGDDAIALFRYRERIARAETPGARAGVKALDETLGISLDVPLELGEPWTDRAFTDLLSLEPSNRVNWLIVLQLAKDAKGSTPTAKWLKQIGVAIEKLPLEQVQQLLAAWLSLVGKPRPAISGGKIPGRDSTIPSDQSADILRGLAFIASRFDTPAMARALGDLAMACFKMVPGHGARCIKPGSSALWSLAQMTTPSALAQLSRLRQLVKFGTAKKMLDTSLDNLAAKLGITTEQLHEIAAPDFGLSSDSMIEEEAGDYTLQLIAEPSGARIRIIGEDAKERKSVPDVIKKEHADTLKALKQAKDDIDKMLEAQRARIDALFIADRTWPAPAWRERYIDHPLVGVLGRRLIWNVIDDPKSAAPGRAILYRPETKSFADLDGKPVAPTAEQHIKLWHPIFAASDDIRRWREVIETANLRQPVKQAHREVYPLTDAERRTATYSNRFAAHIIKQHAFQQLAADRGWKSKLRLMVDAEYPPPMRELPSWALRAEFWVESIGDDYGTDTTESGSYLYLATDQVRFYRTGAAQAYAHAGGGGYETYGPDEAGNHPVPLEQIPPLVLSEILRDVDLFVAGASVGNNADWQDGGPDGRFREYWNAYSFGVLSASGKARREFLERLVPRLKIAPQCAFEGDFLIVKGSLRTYKIHMGSGNILMKPNDQYLCIVPNSTLQADNGPGGLFLPFDGDRTLSIILSKAFMLADDTRIKDASITSQIKRG